jgi:hypothetical protein
MHPVRAASVAMGRGAKTPKKMGCHDSLRVIRRLYKRMERRRVDLVLRKHGSTESE